MNDSSKVLLCLTDLGGDVTQVTIENIPGSLEPQFSLDQVLLNGFGIVL